MVRDILIQEENVRNALIIVPEAIITNSKCAAYGPCKAFDSIIAMGLMYNFMLMGYCDSGVTRRVSRGFRKGVFQGGVLKRCLKGVSSQRDISRGCSVRGGLERGSQVGI